jgi:hypothetical protein
MGAIFRDDYDDQQDSLLKSIAIGNTWQFRIYRIKAYLWGTVASLATGTTALLVDYAIIKWTGNAGVIGWLLG